MNFELSLVMIAQMLFLFFNPVSAKDDRIFGDDYRFWSFGTKLPTYPVQCLVDVAVSCIWDKGKDCMEITTPQKQCEGGGILSFTYIGGDCSQSTTQSGSCEDFDTHVSEISEIACFTDDGNISFFGEVSVGDLITVPESGTLSGVLTCDIFSSGKKKQTVYLDGHLYLKDIYGGLQIESCNDDDNDNNCLIPVEYAYTIKNIGESFMDVTSLERTIFIRRMINNITQEGEATSNLIELVKNNSLEVGENTIVTESGLIDVCAQGEYNTSVVVKGNSTVGIPCDALGKYEARTTAEDRHIDVLISCRDERGASCGELTAPALQCSERNDIDFVTFTYLGGGCYQSSNTHNQDCEDFNNGPFGTRVSRITCSGDSDIIFDNLVDVGELITVPSYGSGPLPNKIVCEISEEGELKQVLKITISDDSDEDLFLKDVYGSLRLESCGDQNCYLPITYVYTLKNVGQAHMTITKFERSRGGTLKHLISGTDDKSLDFGETRFIQEKALLDVCAEAEVVTVTTVEADSPKGVLSTNVDRYMVVTGPEVGRLDIEITCEDENRHGCDDIQPPSFNCNVGGCADHVLFSYIGPLISSSVICTDESGIVLVSKNIIIGERVNLSGLGSQNGPSVMVDCQLINPNSGELVQEIKIDTCDGLFLKEVYGGSFRLEGCDEKNCLAPIKYTYTLENIGTNSLEISELQRMRDGRFTVDLLDNVGTTKLLADETTTFTEDEELDVCAKGEIITTIQAKVNSPNGKPYLEENEHAITTGNVLTTPPTKLPIEPSFETSTVVENNVEPKGVQTGTMSSIQEGYSIVAVLFTQLLHNASEVLRYFSECLMPRNYWFGF